MKFLPKFSPRNSDERRRTDVYKELLHYEAKMGGTLFGPIPAGHRREFFCLDRYTWVWHEEWIDGAGAQRALTTRYDIRPQGILKSQGTNTYQSVHGEELRNLSQAAQLYYNNLNAQLIALQS